ncbi:hypothetical protein Pan153_01260 [Gimesia panareensis]|uniref:DUF1559 domain-containing protein n=1 Tax=Gimesia panareensis TaxID=2527978 RepID=A0A518FGP5_9PLAN|nr:DUF1559 domain-containing protein [Gimesia panareensis]QDV15512.1 hypothetical protein Pan153_01260 [Gimesia panareensis]
MENETKKSKGPTKTEIAVGFMCFLILFFLGGMYFIFRFLFYVLLGWYPFLNRVLPQVSVSIPGVVTACLILVLLTVVIQVLGTKVIRSVREKREDFSLSPWRFRWTGVCLILLIVSFTGGLAVVGVAHRTFEIVKDEQESFLASTREFKNEYYFSLNQRNVAEAVEKYSAENQRQLPAGIVNATGIPLHSWETQLLPYLDSTALFEKIDLSVPWNSQQNAEHFQTSIPVFIRVGSTGDQQFNREGFGLSHMALNSRIAVPGHAINAQQVPDGLANTIMLGEIKTRLPAWGDPLNFRDPASGINKHPHGFGTPGKLRGGANMLFLDGSVRFISEDIDPKILKALATPNGGEDVSNFQGGR